MSNIDIVFKILFITSTIYMFINYKKNSNERRADLETSRLTLTLVVCLKYLIVMFFYSTFCVRDLADIQTQKQYI